MTRRMRVKLIVEGGRGVVKWEILDFGLGKRRIGSGLFASLLVFFDIIAGNVNADSLEPEIMR